MQILSGGFAKRISMLISNTQKCISKRKRALGQSCGKLPILWDSLYTESSRTSLEFRQ